MESEQAGRTLVLADADNLWQLNRFYKRNGHKGKAALSDLGFWLEGDDGIIAGLRLSTAPEYSLMRGLWVERSRQRQGLGSELIEQSRPYWPRRPCFCFPYSHLEPFYQRLGFRPASAFDVPRQLSLQLQRYQTRGDDLILMGCYLP
ncbi:GNAT family N-acetyltransferase [Marinobacterium jannaschii]|uniref:GNAT family N-acetyltransferase n=1 Tax=Marinobacterium jannaschii TaxID=64970 RepID=UPI000481787E|nr:GNAT family N-acetyltransferase [Marinobacterium jannaschii]